MHVERERGVENGSEMGRRSAPCCGQHCTGAAPHHGPQSTGDALWQEELVPGWLAAALVLTLFGPFVESGNGFFACWVGVAAAVAFAWEERRG